MKTAVTPISYKLKIETLPGFKYKGEVEIEANLYGSMRKFELDSVGLEVSSVEIFDGRTKSSARFIVDKKRGKLAVYGNSPFPKHFTIIVNFSGTNNDKMYGFYRSKYVIGGKEQYLLTTQFESSDARSAFPCFDNPSLKAIFYLTLVIDKELMAVSNMPVKSEKIEGKKKIVEFHATPRMSTYLLYMGVGNFESISGKLGKLPVRVLTTPGNSMMGKMALGFAKKFVEFYENYFGVKYALPKLDLIAIPDFSAGAMENWGAITFREIALLADEKNVSVSIMQNIAITVAHELAHQWFGDLVTMEWWDDLWLNESFATYMSYKAVDAVFPKWQVLRQYLLDTLGSAFVFDSLKSTHPISVKVRNQGEIESIFDAISYEKGGSILYMLEGYVGSESFRKGLHNYLIKHKYGNASKEDLWNSISEVAKAGGNKLTVSKVMAQWINKPGYPMVHVERNNASRNFSMHQRRFILAEDDEGTWPIPLNILDSSGNATKMLMTKANAEAGKNAEWIKLNYRQNGFYRVSYSDDLLQELGTSIDKGKISGVDLWGIENDLFYLARSSRIKVSTYINFVRGHLIKKIDEYPLNISIINHAMWIYKMLGKSNGAEAKRVISDYCNAILYSLGWKGSKGEGNIEKMLRPTAILALGNINDYKTIKKANGIYKEHRNDISKIDPNIRGAIYTIFARTSGAKAYNDFISKYLKEKMPDEQRRLLGAIGEFTEDSLLKKALSFALSKDVRLQDTFIIPAHVASNISEDSLDILWEWTKANWGRFLSIFPPSAHMLGRLVENFSSAKEKRILDEIKEFFSNSKNTREDMIKEYKRTLEYIEANIKFVESNR